MSETLNTDIQNTPETGILQEQTMMSTESNELNGAIGSTDAGADPMNEWKEAMAEQDAASGKQATNGHDSSSPSNLFKQLQPATEKLGEGLGINVIKDIPVQLSVELGRKSITIQKLLQLGQGSVVELNNLAGEPMDIFINGYYIAQGEVVVVDNKYAVRLTDIISPSDRLAHFSSKR